MSTPNVLITGATSGIGLELAHQFAQHRHPLVLTGRREDELKITSVELHEQYGVPVKFVTADLEATDAAARLFDALNREQITVDILVNNAGLGYCGRFWEIPLEQHLSILRVNVEATLGLLHFFLPPMLARRQGRILVTASIAGFEPGPNLASYHASKAYVLSLCESLAEEIKESGVTLTALCPGPTDTDFFPKADMVDTTIFQKGKVASPQEVAKAGYDALMRGDRIIVPGAMNKVMVFARRLISESAQAKMNEKMYEKNSNRPRRRESGQVRAKAARSRK